MIIRFETQSWNWS